MTLAQRPANGLPAAAAPRPQADLAIRSLDEMWTVAKHVADSKLFPVRTPQEAFTLMLLCQSEGLHPMAAMRRYHVIQGRPAMRSDAVQGEMQARGWLIQPKKRTREEARAVFAHPSKCPDGFELAVTFDQFKAAGLTGKDNWKNYPDDMLWARLVTKACRTLDPGIIAGVYSPEEIDDSVYLESPQGRHAVVDARAVEVLRRADVTVPGQPEGAVDDRHYRAVAECAAEACGLDAKKLHGHLSLQAVTLGYLDPPVPLKVAAAVTALTKVYALHREWVRAEVASWCAGAAAEPEPEAVAAEIEAGEWEPGSDG